MKQLNNYILEKLHLDKSIYTSNFNENDFKELKKKKDGNFVIVIYRYSNKPAPGFKIINYDKYTNTINKQKEYLRLHPKRHPIYPYNEWSFIAYTDTKEEAQDAIAYLRTLKEYSYVSEHKENISEKLHLNKNIVLKNNVSIKEIIDNFFKDIQFNDKYEVTIDDKGSNELYITIDFDKNLDNTKIHEIGYKLFNELFDEEKYKPYNRGTDWWVSNPTTIRYNFGLK